MNMELNKHGVFVSGYESIRIGNPYLLGVEVRVGEQDGKWGYTLHYTGKTSGYGCPFTPSDLQYDSRMETLKRAKATVLGLSVIKEFPQKLIRQIDEMLGEEQLELF